MSEDIGADINTAMAVFNRELPKRLAGLESPPAIAERLAALEARVSALEAARPDGDRVLAQIRATYASAAGSESAGESPQGFPGLAV